MKKHLVTILLAALAFSSCIYEYEPDLSSEVSRLVIEGDISLGEVCYFRCGRLSLLQDSFFGMPAVYSCEFIVSDEFGNTYYGSQYATPIQNYGGEIRYIAGRDAVIDLTSAPADRKYKLIVYATPDPGGDQICYETPWITPQPAPEIGDISERLIDADGDGNADNVAISLNLSAENSSGCYRWSYEELYYFRSILDTPDLELFENGNIYDHNNDIVPVDWWPYSWCWRTTTSRRAAVAIARALEGWNLKDHEFLRMGLSATQLLSGEYYIRLNAKTIPEEEYKYINAVNQGSEGLGSLLSPIPSEMIGNLRNPADSTDYAIGYVGVNTVSRRICKVRTVGRRLRVDERNYLRNPSAELTGMNLTLQQMNLYLRYTLGLYPYKDIDGVRYWTPIECVDCRASGGVLDKPKGWDMDLEIGD